MSEERGKGIFMRECGVWIGMAVLALWASQASAQGQAAPTQVPGAGQVAAPGDYRIHGGDQLLVGVYDDPKMPPMTITVTPDGKFNFPLLGSITAGGKTPEQLRVEMETRLRKFVAEPVVTVTVTGVAGNVAYVVGQVQKPGLIVMNPAVNVMQALAIAGGGNPYAKMDGIIIIRGTTGKQNVMSFHYGQVSAGRSLEQNIQLEAGDVVVVP
jgi:polysaccharide biosynthesis/export protein